MAFSAHGHFTSCDATSCQESYIRSSGGGGGGGRRTTAQNSAGSTPGTVYTGTAWTFHGDIKLISTQEGYKEAKGKVEFVTEFSSDSGPIAITHDDYDHYGGGHSDGHELRPISAREDGGELHIEIPHPHSAVMQAPTEPAAQPAADSKASTSTPAADPKATTQTVGAAAATTPEPKLTPVEVSKAKPSAMWLNPGTQSGPSAKSTTGSSRWLSAPTKKSVPSASSMFPSQPGPRQGDVGIPGLRSERPRPRGMAMPDPTGLNPGIKSQPRGMAGPDPLALIPGIKSQPGIRAQPGPLGNMNPPSINSQAPKQQRKASQAQPIGMGLIPGMGSATPKKSAHEILNLGLPAPSVKFIPGQTGHSHLHLNNSTSHHYYAKPAQSWRDLPLIKGGNMKITLYKLEPY